MHCKKLVVKKYFEKTAEKWDMMRKSFYDEKLRTDVIKTAGIRRGFNVLDVGVGTGFMAMGAARAVGRDGKVIGVDISKAMMARARRNLARQGVAGRVEFRVGDMENLPLENRQVDAVICNMGLHHSPKPQNAINEMVRVLKVGGKLAISDLEEHNEKWLRKEMADVWLGFNLKKMEAMLRKAGLRNVQVKLARTKCCGVSIAGRRAAIGIFIASGRK